MTATIPSVHFDTGALPPDQRFQVWRSALHAHQVWLPPGTDSTTFTALVDGWTLGDIVLAHSRLPAICLARTREMALKDGEDWISLAFQLNGTTVFTLDQGEVVRTVGPGEIIVFDMTRDFKSETSVHDVITCAVSRRAIAQAIVEIPDHHGILIDGGWGRLLADYLLSLVRQLPGMEAKDAPGLSKTFVHLLAACLKAGRVPVQAVSGRAANVRHLAETFIEANLASPGLAPAEICQAVGISKAHLYRLFMGSGGVSSYIRKRRLEAIHVLLNDPREGRGIGEIAYQYGFTSVAHFSRVFRKNFGFSPRDVRLGLPVIAEVDIDDDETATFRRWIQRLS
jgi:AraC-like DNA-binding protein